MAAQFLPLPSRSPTFLSLGSALQLQPTHTPHFKPPGAGMGGRGQQFAFASSKLTACPTVCRALREAEVQGGLNLCPAGTRGTSVTCT